MLAVGAATGVLIFYMMPKVEVERSAKHGQGLSAASASD
jgi:hypothetical protein